MTLRAGEKIREGNFINASERDATPANDEDKLPRLNDEAKIDREFLETLDVQEFAADGNWTKPEHGKFVIVEMWGAGGAGGAVGPYSYCAAGGGGGGQYHMALIPFDFLDASETVTVGEGGQTSGADGEDSSFGTWATAEGGAGGQTISNGTANGGAGGSTGDDEFMEMKDQAGATGAGAYATQFTGGAGDGVDAVFAGASGGAAASTSYGAQEFAGAGGTSEHGGDGGAGLSPLGGGTAEDGQFPGGGGGGCASRYSGGARVGGKGGNGFVRVTVI